MRSNDLAFDKKRVVVLHEADWTCAYCGAEANEADHIWPRKWGGTDDLDNLQALCRKCNASKGDNVYFRDVTPARIDLRIPIHLEGAEGWILNAARWKSVQRLMVDEGADAADAYNHCFAEGADPNPDALRWALSQIWIALLHETPGQAALDALAELDELRLVDVEDLPAVEPAKPSPIELALEMYAVVSGLDSDEPDEVAS